MRWSLGQSTACRCQLKCFQRLHCTSTSFVRWFLRFPCDSRQQSLQSIYVGRFCRSWQYFSANKSINSDRNLYFAHYFSIPTKLFLIINAFPMPSVCFYVFYNEQRTKKNINKCICLDDAKVWVGKRTSRYSTKNRVKAHIFGVCCWYSFVCFHDFVCFQMFDKHRIQILCNFKAIA